VPLYQTLIFVVAGIGLIDTLYLSYHAMTKKPVKCLFFPPEWCAKVQQSPQSHLFGFPNAYAGLALYAVIIVCLHLFIQGDIPFWPTTLVVLLGCTFSLYFTYIQSFALRAFCLWCLLSAINFLILLIAIFFLRG